jgi:hypothetical protein
MLSAVVTSGQDVSADCSEDMVLNLYSLCFITSRMSYLLDSEACMGNCTI